MIKYTLELSTGETKVIGADGATQDNLGFVKFYKDIGKGEEKKVVITYNPAFIVSMVSEDDTPRPLQ